VVVGPGQSHCYAHDPNRSQERKRNASRGGRSKSQGELGELKRRIRSLAAEVLDGSADRGRASVANQLYNTLIRAIEQERKQRELEELAGRLEALEEVLKGRRSKGA
jgi:hypothetical protein